MNKHLIELCPKLNFYGFLHRIKILHPIIFLSILIKLIPCSGINSNENYTTQENYYAFADNTENKYYRITKTLKGHKVLVRGIKELKITKGFLASYDDIGQIILWNEKSNFEKKIILRGHSARINDLIELSNGLLASASSDHQLNLWDPKRNFSCIYNVTNEDYQSVIYIRDFIKNNDLFLISVNSFGNIFVHILNKDNFPSFYKKLTNTTYAEKEKISDFTVLKSGFLVTSHKTIIRIYNLNEDFVLYKEINLEKFQEQKAKRKFGCDENNKNLCNDNYKENKKEKIEKNINENSYKNETNEKSMIIKHHSIQKLKQFKNGNIIVVTNLFLFVFNSITEMKLILKERFTGAYMGGGVFSHIQELESGYAAISSNDNTIKIFDPLKNYKLVFSLPTGSDNFITYLYELKNGLMIASTNCDIFIFNPNENFQIVLQIKDLTASRITGITELNSGYLAISSFDENIYILDRFHNFSLLRTVFIEKAQSIQNYLEIKNKKSKYFGCILASNKHNLMIFDPKESFKLIANRNIPNFDYCLLSLTEMNSGLITSCGQNNNLILRDPENDFEVVKSIELKGQARSIYETSDNLWLVSSNNDNTFIMNPQSDYEVQAEIRGIQSMQLKIINYFDENGILRIYYYENYLDDFEYNNYNNNKSIINSNQTLKNTTTEIPKIILTIDEAHQMLIYNKDLNFTLIDKFSIHESFINAFIELQDGKIASCSEDKNIRIWNLYFYENFTKVNLTAITQIEDAHQSSVDSLTQLKNGLLVSSSFDKILKFWDLNAFLNEKNTTDKILNQKINVNRNIFKLYETSFGLIFSEDNYFKILKHEYYNDLKFQVKISKIIEDKKDKLMLNMLNLHSDNSGILFGATNLEGNLKLFRLKNNVVYNHKISRFPFTKAIAIKNSDNKLIALACYDREIMILDMSYHLDVYVISTFNFHKNPIRELISLENSIMISCGGDGFVAIWDMLNFNMLYSFQADKNSVNSCVVLNEKDIKNKNNNNKLHEKDNDKSFNIVLATTVNGNNIYIWDINFQYVNSEGTFKVIEKSIKTIKIKEGRIKSILNLNDENFIVSTREKYLYVYNKKDFEIKKRFKFPNNLNSMIFIKSNEIAVSFVDGRIQVLNFDHEFKEYFVIKSYCCHTNQIVNMIYTGDKYIISSSTDNLIYWNYSNDLYGKYIYLDSFN